jgi:hypothetical protein
MKTHSLLEFDLLLHRLSDHDGLSSPNDGRFLS